MRLQASTTTTSSTTDTTGAERGTGRSFWPDAVAFREAIQNPQAAFSDPELRNAEVAQDRRGLPIAYCGRFAVVFRITNTRGQTWALRCFTSAANGGSAAATDAGEQRAARYRALAAHMELAGDCFVPCRYIENGIRVGSQVYPVVMMRWANGRTLARFVEDHLDNPDALRTLCATLSDLLETLEAASIAHGDWQHDNLIVSEEGRRVVLVDYDGMYVPDLAGQPSPERGHPNYQHPARSAAHYGPGLDRFACLVMQTALLALARDPALWTRFSDGESLLFKQADFRDCERSPVFRALRELAGNARDEALADSLARLEDACFSGPDSALLPAAVAPFAPAPKAVFAEPEVREGEEVVTKTYVAGSGKWWQNPEVAVKTLVAPKKPPFIAAATAAAGAAAASVSLAAAPQNSFTFLSRLQTAEALAAEQKHLRSWRIAPVCFLILVCFLIFFLSHNGGGGALFVLGYPLASVLGLGYSSWPRKKVVAELNTEFEKMGRLIEERWDRIGQLKQSLHAPGNTVVIGSTAAEKFVTEKLRQTGINRAINVPGITPSVVQQLRRHKIDNALELRGWRKIEGLTMHQVTALQQWVQELELSAADEYRQAHVPNTKTPGHIAQLEHEIAEFEREREKLTREKAAFPSTSFRTYFRLLIGREKVAAPPTTIP